MSQNEEQAWRTLRDAALDPCGFEDGAEVTASGSMDNDLAHGRVDAIVEFVKRVRRHSLPRKELKEELT